MKNKIQYAFKYYDSYDLYTIRRLDGLELDYIPEGLIRVILADESIRTGKSVIILEIDKAINYTSNALNAVVDLKGRKYNQVEIDDIISNIEKKEYEELNNKHKFRLFKRK